MRPLLYTVWGLALVGCSFKSPGAADMPGGTGTDGSIGSVLDGPGSDIDAAIDAPPMVYAATCAELGEDARDKDVTLYMGKDPNKPWAAHCRDADLKTYLILGAPSMSAYPDGGCAGLIQTNQPSVVTTWTMVRFNPLTGVVSTGDFFGSTSTGGTHETSGNGAINNDYRKVPFAAGRSCGNKRMVTKVDLTRSKFRIADGQQWFSDGFMSDVNVNLDGAKKTLTFDVGGNPTGQSGCGGATDYYTLAGGDCVKLTYAP